jgi:hypothetical protein
MMILHGDKSIGKRLTVLSKTYQAPSDPKLSLCPLVQGVLFLLLLWLSFLFAAWVRSLLFALWVLLWLQATPFES